MSTPYWSVIIPVRDNEPGVRELGERLLTQTAGSEAEYILVDDHSTDGTPEAIERFVRLARARGLTASSIRLDLASGAYAARNAGLRTAAGRVFVFTDSDCQPAPGWLEAYAPVFKTGGAGIAAGTIRSLPGSSWAEQYADERGILSQEGPLVRKRPWAQTANLAVSRQVFARVGLFRRLASAGDADFCFRAEAAGWKLVYVPAALVYHQHRRTLAGLYRQYLRYGRGRTILRGLYENVPEVLESMPLFPGWDRVIARARELAAAAVRGRIPWRQASYFLLCEVVTCAGARFGSAAAGRSREIPDIEPWAERPAGHAGSAETSERDTHA